VKYTHLYGILSLKDGKNNYAFRDIKRKKKKKKKKEKKNLDKES